MGVINILYLKKEITLGYSEDQFVQMLLHLNGDFDDDLLQDTLRLLTGIDWYVYQWNKNIKIELSAYCTALGSLFCPIFEDGDGLQWYICCRVSCCRENSSDTILVIRDCSRGMFCWLFFGIGQHILPIICIIVMIRDQYKHTNNL